MNEIEKQGRHSASHVLSYRQKAKNDRAKHGQDAKAYQAIQRGICGYYPAGLLLKAERKRRQPDLQPLEIIVPKFRFARSPDDKKGLAKNKKYQEYLAKLSKGSGAKKKKK